MFDKSELRGFSGEECAAARKSYQATHDALEYFEHKIDQATVDPLLSAASAKFIDRLWRGARSKAELSLASRAVWEVHGKASILSHIKFCRDKPELMLGATRARLITLSPSVGITDIAGVAVVLPQLRGFADRTARKLQLSALFTFDIALFCPSRSADVDTVAQHIQGTVWSQNTRFQPSKQAKRIGDACGQSNTLAAPIGVIKTRGASSGNTLGLDDFAGLGWYASKLSCGVNTCYMTKKGRRSENSHTGWQAKHALRQLELWSHMSVLDACWGVGHGKTLRMLWRERLTRLLECPLGCRLEISHGPRTASWVQVWRELGTGYRAI